MSYWMTRESGMQSYRYYRNGRGMMELDFTLKNGLINKYFQGDDSYLPAYELLYLHTHPLIMDNFINEISALIAQAGKAIVDNKLGPYYTDKLSDIAITIGQSVEKLNAANTSEARKTLEALREAYQLSRDLISMV